MGRRPASDIAIPIQVSGVSFRVASSTLKHLPATPIFLQHLLGRGVSAAVAGEYTRVVAKMIRDGLINAPDRVTRLNERTAAKAYWAWIESSYDARVQPVLRAFSDDYVRKGIKWLRVHSLVGPAHGKRIPRIVKMAQLHLDGSTMSAVMTPAEVAWVETSAVTLHVPTKPVPAHSDPCADCIPFELEPEQVEVLAAAFERTWGHRDVSRVPADALLFGTPPLEGGSAVQVDTSPVERIVGLAPAGQVSDALTQLGGSVARTPEAFRARLAEGVDIVFVSRSAAGDELFERVLAALRA